MLKNDKNKLDIDRINSSVKLLNKILRISYILIILGLIYGATILLKEWKIIELLEVTIKIIKPLFIGFVFAWLLHPLVSLLRKKQVNRILGTTIVYALFIGMLYWLISSIIPVLASQINDLVGIIPNIINHLSLMIQGIFDNLNNNTVINMDSYFLQIYNGLANFGKDMTTALPAKTIHLIGGFFSGVGTLLVSLIVGYYLLINFDRVDDLLLSLLPKKARHDARILGKQINESLNNYVRGTLLISSIIFITNYIGFLIIGVNSPLLFAIFCGITNIIPYIGPYIGGIPVALVALSQGTTIGLFTILYVVGIQLLEGMILQPLVMSKAMKLHPVTIIIGLLIFGYFFGIVGMVFATPIIAVSKIIFNHFDDKYDLLKYKNID